MNISYEDQICEAIEYIVDHAIAKANFDKTIQATVVNCVDSGIGKYKIKYQDSSFYAYSSDTNSTYSNGSEVFILVPGNDMSQTKTILGLVNKTEEGFSAELNDEDMYEIIGNNCVTSLGTYGLCSYDEKNVIVLYEKDSKTNLLNFNEEGFNEYMKQAKYIACEANMKTNLSEEQKIKGNYGLGFNLKFKNASTEELITKTYTLDVDKMLGNPYELNDFTKQSGIFEIDNENFKYVESIFIFNYNFPVTKENQAKDIFIKDISLSCAKAIPQKGLEDGIITFVTPEGTYFNGNSLETDTRSIQAHVKIKGKKMKTDSNTLRYYWFKENAKVDTNSEKYYKLGGRGWECLNEFDEKSKEWLAAEYTLLVSKKDLVSKEAIYKCVVIYKDEITIENEITLKNLKSNYDISLTSSNGTKFYFDRGRTNLVCTVNGEENNEDYTYVWTKLSSDGQYTFLDATEELNNDFHQTELEYSKILQDLKEQKIYENAAAPLIKQKTDKLEEYKTITRIENNTIYHLAIDTIDNFSIFKCAVFHGEVYLGTSSIMIINSFEVEPGYSLIINNGNTNFQYNEEGLAPTNESLLNPLTLPDISFDLYDGTGEKFDEKTLSKCKIKWIVPSKNTMIRCIEEPSYTTDNEYVFENCLTLPYDIEPLYDINKGNNSIQLIVEYKDLVLKQQAELSFTKQGSLGTNGTIYSCKIIPNLAENQEKITYPMFTNGALNYTRPSGQSDVWFKVQLWRNGENIFEGSEGNNSSEGKKVEIEWGVLKNKYTSTISDNSNIVIVDKRKGRYNYQSLSDNVSRANIIECTITYDGIVYYATMPVIVVTTGTDYKVKLKENTGFSYALYATDGTNPQYNSTKPFEVEIFQRIAGFDENISLLKGSLHMNYQWTIDGEVYDIDAKKMKKDINLYEYNIRNEVLNANQYRIKPNDVFSGYCVSNTLKCVIKDDKNIVRGTIIIPIYLCLNRYGLAALNGWNGNSISINEKGGFILAPQIGAGKKEDDNSFTGMFMGVVKEAGSELEETGLFAYNHGIRSIFLDAKTGSAKFGTSEGSQFVITPATAADSGDKAVIAIHNNKTGKDVFKVTKDGSLSITGDGNSLDISTNNTVKGIGTTIQSLEGEIALKVEKDDIINSINVSSEGATINANKINLKGAVTISDFDTTVSGKLDKIDNQIVRVETQYYSSSSRLKLVGGTWGTQTPTAQDGKFIWMRNVYYYEDTTKEPGRSEPVCITGDAGATGQARSISQVKEWYLKSPLKEGITSENYKNYTWEETIPLMDSVNKYLWNYEEIFYTDGKESSVTPPGVIGMYGEVGKGIQQVYEYYLATSKNSGITRTSTGWTTDLTSDDAKISAVKKYLWNYEITVYTDGEEISTEPAIIGVYGDKGDDGTAVVEINNYYLKSSKNTGITRTGTTGWQKNTIPALDATNKYLWNYEETTLTKGSPKYTEAHIAAVYSQDGRGIKDIKEMYAASLTPVQPSKSSFNEEPPVLSPTNKYLWCYEIIEYTDGTKKPGDNDAIVAHIIGVYGDQGENGRPGNDGNGIETTTVKYCLSTSGVTKPATTSFSESMPTNIEQGKYLWIWTRIIYNNGSYKDSYSVSYQGKDGANGLSIKNIKNQYQQSNSNKTAPTGTWTDECPGYNKDKPYTWFRQNITWSDNKTTQTTPVVLDSLGESLKQAYEAHAAMVSWAMESDSTYINGANIYTGTIGADKIYVNDLENLKATIGGFKIDQQAIRTDKKTGMNDTTAGIYMDKDGQIFIGDGKNQIRFYKRASDNKWVMDIYAEEIHFGSNQQSLTTAVEVINQKIDEVEIGGINLIKNSDFSYSKNKLYNWTAEGVSVVAESNSIYGNHLKITGGTGNKRIYSNTSNVWYNGQTYMVSFYAKAATTGSKIKASRSLIDYTSSDFTLTTEWKRYTGIIKSTATVDAGTLSFSRTDTKTDAIYIARIKLETGNRATTWSPAPEDTALNLSNLQTQVDDRIRTYSQSTDPSKSWDTTENHSGDLWYNTLNGYKQVSRWDGSKWVLVTDEAEAIAAAELASTKAQVFLQQPKGPYKVGDLWISEGEVYTCITANSTKDGYSASHWNKKLKYTDDTIANEAKNKIDNLQIGGRNLLLNSNFAKGIVNATNIIAGRNSGWSIPTNNTTLDTNVTYNGHNTLHRYRTGITADSWSENQYYYFRDSSEVTRDVTYTLSYWIYTTNADWLNKTGSWNAPLNDLVAAVRMRDSSNNNVGEIGLASPKPTEVNVWQKRQTVFTIPANKNCSWFYFFDSARRNCDYYITDFKLEIGNRATDWTPAPEDIEQDIADAVKNIEIGGANLLRGTNTVTKLTSTGRWDSATWRSASGGTGTRESVTVTDAPNPSIKLGWHIAQSTDTQVTISQDVVPTVAGQTYILSCYAKGTGNVSFIYGNDSITYQRSYIPIVNGTKWEKYSFIFTSKGTGNAYFGCDKKTDDIYICGMKLEKGNKATDWTPAPEDTSTYVDNLIVDLNNQIDNKIGTFNQETDPSIAWTTTELKNAHIGDLWYRPSTKKTQRWSGTAWAEIANSESRSAAAIAASKAQIFINTPTIPYYKGDLWITSTNMTGVVKTCTTTRITGSYTASDWVEGLKYTDDTTVNNLKIGGRNLWIDSENILSYSGVIGGPTNFTYNIEDSSVPSHKAFSFELAAGTGSGGPYFLYAKNIVNLDKLILNEIYTVSWYAKAQKNTTLNPITFGESQSGISASTDTTVTTSWKKFYFTYKWTSTSKNTVSMYFTKLASETNKIWISSPQIEIGNKATDWTPAPEDIKNEVSALESNLQAQIDGKIQTWYQSTDPSTAWTTNELKNQHNGDLWCYTGNTTTTYTKNATYIYTVSNNAGSWKAYSATKELFDEIDGKTTIYYGKTTGTYTGVSTGDYLIDDSTGSTYRYNNGWVKVTDYQTAISNIQIGGKNILRGTDIKALITAREWQNGQWDISSGGNGTGSLINVADSPVPSLTRAWVISNNTSGNRDFSQLNVPFKNKKEYTFSVWCKGSGTLFFRIWRNSLSTGQTLLQKTVTYNEWTKQVVTFTTDLSTSTSNALLFGVTGSCTEMRFIAPKLEEGNKSTDWTPAPEDTNTLQIGGRNLLQEKNIVLFSGSNFSKANFIKNGEVSITCKGGNDGFRIDKKEYYEPNTQYMLSYYVTVTIKSGALFRWSGWHTEKGVVQTGEYYIDEKRYTVGIDDAAAAAVLSDGKRHKIVHVYMSKGTIAEDTGNNYTFIQPPRGASGTYELVCKFEKLKMEKGTKATDWSVAPEDTFTYTDNLISDLQTQVDGKIQTFSQSSDPSTGWSATDKTLHTGDLWYDTTNSVTKRWSGSAWVKLTDKDATDATNLAKKKAQIFTATPTIPYYKGDLWFTSTSSKAGVIKTCIVTRESGSYTAADWVETTKYTDDTIANTANQKVDLLSGDPTNYSQLNDSTASHWGFTADNTVDGHWYNMNSLSRDKFISGYYDCNGGEKFSIDYEISTSCQANTTSSGDKVIKYAGTALGLYGFNDNNTSVGIQYAQRVTASAEAPVTKISSTVSVPSNSRKFRIFVQTEAWDTFSGFIKIRNVRVRKCLIQSTDVEYYLSTSSTSLSGGSWVTTAPAWVNGKYMWSRTKTILQNGTIQYAPSETGTCIAGASGANALQTTRNWTGTFTTIGQTATAYTSDFNRAPSVGDTFNNLDGSSNTGTWQVTAISGTAITIKLLSYVSSKGATGATGKGVNKIEEQYYLSTSNSAQSGGSWSATQPNWTSGKYIWTRSHITWSDGTVSDTTPVLATGLNTANSVANDANTKIDNLEVGGTNLAKIGTIKKYGTGTATTVNYTTYEKNGSFTFSRTAVRDEGPMLDNGISFKKDKQYVISFYLKFNVNTVNNFYVYNGHSWINTKVYIDNVYKNSFHKEIPFPTDLKEHKIDLYFTANADSSLADTDTSTTHTIFQPVKTNAIAYTATVRGFKLEEGNKPTTWSPAPEDIYGTIDNLEIGGRNLFLKTNFPEKISLADPNTTNFRDNPLAYYNENTYTISKSDIGAYNQATFTLGSTSNIGVVFRRYATDINLDSTSTYTMSAWVKVSVAGMKIARIRSYYNKSNSFVWRGGENPIEIKEANKWTKIELQFKPDADTQVTSYGFTSNYGNNATFSICGVKFEKGDKATDWSPAPEDIINNLEIGGRNLLIGTETAKSKSTASTTSYVTFDPYFTNNKTALSTFGIQENDEMTLSFDWSITKNGSTAFTYGNFRAEFIDAAGGYIGVIKNPIDTFSATNIAGHAEATVKMTTTTVKAIGFRIRIDNSALIFSIKNAKLEKGNKATSWTLAPEDISNNINTAKNEAINEANTNVINKIKEAKIEIINDVNNLIKMSVTDGSGKSEMQQTSNGWTFSLKDIRNELNGLSTGINGAENRINTLETKNSELGGKVGDIEDKTAYINMGTYNSNPCILLGKENNPFKVRITNTAIDFLENGEAIAYANNEAFHSKKSVVETQLQFGKSNNLFVWTKRDNNHFSLLYIK